jgi:hypothetical protein
MEVGPIVDLITRQMLEPRAQNHRGRAASS